MDTATWIPILIQGSLFIIAVILFAWRIPTKADINATKAEINNRLSDMNNRLNDMNNDMNNRLTMT